MNAALILVWGPIVALFGWLLIVKPLLVLCRNPQRDVLRIKRDLEGQGRTVTAVRRVGTTWGREFHSPTYRKYAATVRRHDGETAELLVGVAFGLASDAELVDEDPEARKAFFSGSRSFF